LLYQARILQNEEEEEEEEEESKFNIAPSLALCTDPSMTHAPHEAGRRHSFNRRDHRVTTTVVTIVHSVARFPIVQFSDAPAAGFLTGTLLLASQQCTTFWITDFFVNTEPF
jgi:hypothetical protein